MDYHGPMTRKIALAVLIPPVAVALYFARVQILRLRRPPAQAALVGLQAPKTPLSTTEVSEVVPVRPSGSKDSQNAAAQMNPPAATVQSASPWKRYRNSQYGFEIAYPPDWEFDSSYQDNYGKPPSGNRVPAYAGETRNLFRLEMDGPTQSHEGGGSYDDGAIVDVRITGTTGIIEDWNNTRERGEYLVTSTPSDWVKLLTSLLGGNVKNIAVDVNGFTGAIQVACDDSNPCKIWGEGGAAYRTLPSGRVLLVSWERMVGGNDFSYQKYFLPMLSSFRLLN